MEVAAVAEITGLDHLAEEDRVDPAGFEVAELVERHLRERRVVVSESLQISDCRRGQDYLAVPPLGISQA